MNKIYFAGPLFCQAEKDFNLRIVTVLENAGYKVFLPQRDGFEAAQLKDKSPDEVSRLIFNKDVSEITESDIFFMILDGRVPDDGACVELGIAFANGKRCYGFKTDARSMEINLDLNPLISECFIKIFYDIDGNNLLEKVRVYLENNNL